MLSSGSNDEIRPDMPNVETLAVFHAQVTQQVKRNKVCGLRAPSAGARLGAHVWKHRCRRLSTGEEFPLATAVTP